MKKTISFFVAAISFCNILSAQIQVDKSKITKQGTPAPIKNADLHVTGLQTGQKVLDIDIYPQIKYNGVKGNFTLQDGKLVPPFTLKHVSFTVPAGKIVYLKMCVGEFPYEVAYSTSQSDITLTSVCGIRSDDAATFRVQFNGISTVIHNNDCKRVFGKIAVTVTEKSTDAALQPTIMTPNTGTAYKGTGTEANTFIPFKNTNANTTPPYGSYVHDASRAIPVITSIVGGSSSGQSVAIYTVGATALREGRVTIGVKSDIASAHKTCDLCDDFSSNVHMAAPVAENILVNRAGTRMVDAAHPRIVMGPYNAHGSRDGSAITATGGTNIDFRVHFTVTGL